VWEVLPDFIECVILLLVKPTDELAANLFLYGCNKYNTNMNGTISIGIRSNDMNGLEYSVALNIIKKPQCAKNDQDTAVAIWTIFFAKS